MKEFYKPLFANHRNILNPTAFVESVIKGQIKPEVVEVLFNQNSASFTPKVIEGMIAGNISPERISIISSNIDSPGFNPAYAERIAFTEPESVEINGKTVQYYPNAAIGAGGVGEFFRVAILDPSTGKLRYTGAKKAKHPGEDLRTEVRGVELVTSMLKNPEILKKYPNAADMFVDPVAWADDNSLIFYEVVEHSGQPLELFDAIDDPAFTTKEVYKYSIESFRALAFMHSQGLLHGDYKPGQVFVSETGALLGDFGTVIPFSRFAENGGILMGQTSKGEPSPLYPLEVGGIRENIYLGHLPNYDDSITPVGITPQYYSSDVYNSVKRNGPEYAWKIDAYSVGVHVESMVTNEIRMQRGYIDENGKPQKRPGDYAVEDVFYVNRSFGDERDAKLLEIARKLKDPNNLTYTVADAVSDMEAIIK